MKERELDLVVFGATGFTGTYILKQVLATAKPGLRGRGRPKRTKINAVLENWEETAAPSSQWLSAT